MGSIQSLLGALVPHAGRLMQSCDLSLFQGKEFYAVLVDGDSPNVFKHAILNVGGQGGYYAHVFHGPYYYPSIMTQQEYDDFLRFHGKKEFYRAYVHVPSPHSAILHLEELLSKKWLWGAIVHNCTNFVDSVLKAGGADPKQILFPMNIPLFQFIDLTKVPPREKP